MTVTKPKREPSLLERAAKVYDFNAHARARDLPETDPVRERAVAAPANTDPTFLAIPEELRAAVGEELPDDFHLPPGEATSPRSIAACLPPTA